MAALIDTSVFIAAERGLLDLDTVTAQIGDASVAMSAITVSELLHGLHRSSKAARRSRREAFVEGLVNEFPVLAFDVLVARAHARLWSDLAGKGVALGAHDLIIAATAIVHDMDVASRDERSFPRVPGLRLIRC